MGSVRERQPGVWEVRVYIGRDPVTQAPRQVSQVVRAGRATKTGRPPKTVMDLMHQLEAEAARGKLGGTSATVSVLLDRHLEHLERKGLSPKTLHTYRKYIDTTINPALGRRPVQKLTAWDLDALYATMAKAGRSSSTIRQHHAILSGALRQAVKWGWCPINVASMASPPTVHQQRIVPPSPEEVRAIVELAEQRNPILAALIMLAALTGARRGELCGLKWRDVDLDAGTVRIARSILDLPGRVEEKATKSHQERTIALGEAGVVLLRLHRDECVERAQMGEVELGPDTYVFSDRIEGSTPIRPDAVTGFFGRVSGDLALPEVHLHSLRHFMATQLASRGDVSARTLAGRLGHADASVSLKVYSAFFPPADVEAAEHVGRLLSRS
jgi:integrase